MGKPRRTVQAVVSELRRRRVLRVAAVYAAVGFVVLQVAELLVPALLLPDWIFRAIVVATLLGFPLALVLSWAIEMTPEGPRRTARTGGLSAASARATLGLGFVLVVFLGGAMGWWYLQSTESEMDAAERTPVIAVLPFEDMSDARGDEHFAAGVAEDILNHLAVIRTMRVVPRQSVARYAGSELGVREIARELGATHLVLGSLRRDEERVLIGVQLIDASSDRQLWSDRYDRELTAGAIFETQGEVARRVAQVVGARLTADERGRLASVPTASVTAYDYVLQGRQYAYREQLDRAAALFRQAIEQDSTYAEAYAELSFVYSAMEGAQSAGEHWVDSARVAARTAISLDPDFAGGYSTLALAQWNGGQLRRAVPNYERALRLQPNDPMAVWGFAFLQWNLGHLDQALALARRAERLAPDRPANSALVGRCHLSLRQYDEAERAYLRALRVQPDNAWALGELGLTYVNAGRLDEAEDVLATIRRLLSNSPTHFLAAGGMALLRGDYEEARVHFERSYADPSAPTARPYGELGFVYSRLGRTEQANAMWRRLASEADTTDERNGAMRSLAVMYAVRGDTAEALRLLDRAYERGWRGWPYPDIRLNPLFADLSLIHI